MTRLLTFLIITLVLGEQAHAQSTSPTLRYFCDFNLVASKDGVEKAKDFKLEFVLETASGKGMMIGNNGFSKVFVVNGPNAVTFLETLGTGAVQSTTITADGVAVHSRNSVIFKELVPSQYYGQCKIIEGGAIIK